MAKRARGTTRPGQRRPIQRVARPAVGRSPVVAPEGLSEAEVGRAAELETQLLAADRVEPAAAAARSIERPLPAEPGPSTQRRAGVSGRLAVEAAEEYRYVARDVRRIARVGGSMFLILLVAYVALLAAGVAGH
jgi:hypothetical protein